MILLHSKDTPSGYPIAMKAITQKQEDKIDKISDKRNIYFYGDINLNNPDDIKIIKDYNFVSQREGSILYTKFDYETGIFTLVPQFNGVEFEQVVKWGLCHDPVLWFKYQHCLLGKPNKVIVYNEGFNEQWTKW